MAIEEVQLTRKVEEIIGLFLMRNTEGVSIETNGDKFGTIYGIDGEWLEEFNITTLATEIVRELRGTG